VVRQACLLNFLHYLCPGTLEDVSQPTPPAKKELRKPQLRILAALDKANSPLSRTKISENASVDIAWVGDHLGRHDADARKEREAKTGYPSLLTLGYAEGKTLDFEGKEERVYEITDAGRKALAAAQQDQTNTSPEQQREQERPERYGLRERFWEGLLSRPKIKTTRHANIAPNGESSWIAAGTGVRGLPLQYVIGQDECRVELYIDRGSDLAKANKRIFDRLCAQKKEIDGSFGSELSWQRLDDKRACRIAYTLAVGGYKSDESKWPEIQDAIIDAMIRLEKALIPHLEKLKTELASEGA
jgi:Domain of unknown function (DUF4268)